MNSIEFEQIYNEAFQSGTGLSFYSPLVQPKYFEYAKATHEELLDAWTDPKQLPDTVESDTWSMVLTTVEHPMRDEFDESDVAAIIRVRFLGRSLIDMAKRNISTNPSFSSNRKDPMDVFLKQIELLEAGAWHDNHPDVEYNRHDFQNQDAASPLHLENWPNGNRLSCLGISIGAAALSELNGFDYVYGNELRTSQSVINAKHQALKNMITQSYSGFFDDPAIKQTFNLLQLRYPAQQGYETIFFDTPDILTSEDEARAFHHYIVIRSESKSSGSPYWMQVDPYALVYSALLGNERLDAAFSFLNTTDGVTSVVCQDALRSVEVVYKGYAGIITALKGHRKELESRFLRPEEYKSKQLMTNLYSSERTTIKNLGSLIFEEEKFAGMEDMMRLFAFLVWESTVVAAAKDILDDENAPKHYRLLTNNLHAPNANVSKYNKLIQDYILDLEGKLAEQVQYDTQARQRMIGLVGQAPYVAALLWYRESLQDLFSVRVNGFPNAAAEFAEPEFMIGSMYLNHYATYRKDGRINVAQHLSRLSPSQLLWQASQQDGGVEDERVKAVGSTISRLKPRQLHPLVSLARDIQLP